MDRADILDLKAELAQALGEKQDEYWQHLKAFIKAKCDRQSLDTAAAKLLSSQQHRSLHNKFIRAILFNVRVDVPPPPIDDTYQGVEVSIDGHQSQQEQSKHQLEIRVKQQLASYARPEELLRFQQFGSVNGPHVGVHAKDTWKPFNQVSLSTRTFKRPKLVNQRASMDIERGLAAPLCSEILALPEFALLKCRILAITRQEGLKGADVSDEVVYLMSKGVETYLQSILSDCIQKIRTGRNRGVLYQPISAPAPKVKNGSDVVTSKVCLSKNINPIRLADLQFSLKLSPHLISQHSIVQERISTAMYVYNDFK